MMALLVFFIGLLVFIVGIVLAVIAALLQAARGNEGGMSGGAVIVIGPIPIVIGSDREAGKTLMILAIILSLVAFLLFLIPYVLRVM
ncbi:TIGR00304 family membrane protein [Desulfurococcus amylolyticus]|nr:DUF131 domain-containing protein [Desulfurococcus amylolyticus]